MFWLVFYFTGERLCSLEEGTPGNGTYTRHGSIFASLAGCFIKKSENGMVRIKYFCILNFLVVSGISAVSRAPMSVVLTLLQQSLS